MTRRLPCASPVLLAALLLPLGACASTGSDDAAPHASASAAAASTAIARSPTSSTTSTSSSVTQAPPASTPVAATSGRGGADALWAAQDWHRAAPAYGTWLAAHDDDGLAWFRYGYSLHADGRLEESLGAHRRASAFPGQKGIALYNLGCAHARLGHADDALAALKASMDTGFGSAQTWRDDVDLASLRRDPRFLALLAELEARTSAAALSTAAASAAGGTSAARSELAAGGDPGLHFWVGEWNVVSRAGQPLGTNRIESSLGGAVLIEHWTNTAGHPGKSWNWKDPATGDWKQVWVTPSGATIEMQGRYADGKMVMEGTSFGADGRARAHRTTLAPLPDGRVRQLAEESDDGGTTWTVGFEGYYEPVAAKG